MAMKNSKNLSKDTLTIYYSNRDIKCDIFFTFILRLYFSRIIRIVCIDLIARKIKCKYHEKKYVAFLSNHYPANYDDQLQG